VNITIRNMQEGDVDAVRQIEAAAFGAWWRGLMGPDAQVLGQRTRVNVLSRLARDPNGCFVAEEDSSVVGFIFSCTWGGVGWFGTFSVLPAHQGRGIGRQLIEASLGYLRQQPIRVIGLETMPESPYNLGLYMKMGFRPRLLTPILSKSLVDVEQRELTMPCWSAANDNTRARWLADLQEATGQIAPGFDYTREVVLTEQYDLGETLIMLDGERAVGMSNVLLTSAREEGAEEYAIVQALALPPAYTNEMAFRALLNATQVLARTRGKQSLIVPVNSRHAWALARLLEWGCRVDRAMVRMTLAGMAQEPDEDDCVNLSRWAG
jgi:ribosomal protein S18 acetylase RimI-like enzyme